MFIMSCLLAIKELLALIGYFSGGSFPPPLKPEEERFLLEKMFAGDNEARDELIHRNMRLVAHIIKKFDSDIDKEDLISIGTIGLIKAVGAYNPNNGAKLATFASKCIENEILMYFRSTSKNILDVSLQKPLGLDSEGNEIKLEDILPNNDSVISRVETSILVKRIVEVIEGMHGREKVVLKMRLGLNSDQKRHSQREIARFLKISRSYVSRIEKRAIEKVARQFSD